MADLEKMKEAKDFYSDIPMENKPFFLRGSNSLDWGMQNRFFANFQSRIRTHRDVGH